MRAVLLLGLAYIPMIGEALRSAANERRLREAGAVEPTGDVYAVMQVVYPACFASMIAEHWIRGRDPDALTVAGAVVFVAAKGLKYWAIASLGSRWTFRVLVPPGSSRIVAGPYRFIRHPNYVGVAGEIVGMMLLAGAPVAGIASLVLFGGLMVARIRVEERALGLRRG
jgi:methyltransferase